MTSLDRRAFLASAGALAAAPAVAANDKITVGMIGVGARAHQLLEAMKKIPEVEIVAVNDAYKGRIERAVHRTGGQARIVKDYREILADKGIDVVTVATPDHWHKRQCIEAMEAGKDVYCEKPLTYRTEEGLEIARAVERTKRILQVGSQGMASARQNKAREMIKAGKLGQVTMIRANYNRNSASGAWIYPIPPDASPETVDWEMFLGDAPRREFSLERFFQWRCYQDYSGGIGTDLFVHLCTTIHHVMGATMASEVMAMGDLYRWKESRDVPDTLNALLRYKEGFTVSLGSTFNNGTGGAGFEFLGTEGSLQIGFRGMTFTPERSYENNDWIVDSWSEALQEDYYKRVGKPERPPEVEPEEFADSADDTLVHMKNFFASVKTRDAVVQDVWAGHHAAACSQLINSSVKRGQMVRWDFERRRELA